MTEAVMQALGVGGPLAILMGMVIGILWKKLTKVEKDMREIQAHYEGDPKDATKIGLIARERAAAQTREDGMRTHFEGRIDAERTENKTLWRETNEAFKGLIEGE